MPTFVYKAKDGPDRTLDGEIVAESQTAAAARLEAMGYIPVWIQEARFGQGKHRLSRRRIASRDVNVFTRQLAGLLRAGVPILRALATIQEQTENERFQKIVAGIVAGVRDGQMLSETLGKYPRIFPELYVNMVRSGESGGVLDEILLRLAEARESEEELKSKVRSAIAYPSLVLTVGIVSVFVIVTFFMPRIMHLFEGTTQVLPLPTRVVMGISRFLAAFWPWIVGALVLALYLLKRMVAHGRMRLTFDGLLLNLPLLGRFMRDTDLVRFARTLALLTRAGIAIDRAIALSASTLLNTVLREAMRGVGRDTVMTGSSLAAGLRRRPEIPAFVTNMVAVGEESGRLEEALAEVAAFYQRELDRDLRLVTTLLEPVLILAIGAVVGFIIFAMLLPIFDLGQAIR